MARKEGYVLCVEDKQVTEEFDFGSFKIIDTTVGIVFHIKGGYDIFVQPRMASLYEHLRWIIDTKKKYDTLSEEMKVVFDSAFTATVANLEIPLFMANSDIYLFDIAQKALECLNAAAEKALNAELMPETPAENGEFERKFEVTELLGKEIENEAQKHKEESDNGKTTE